MAARLEWKNDTLFLGPFGLLALTNVGGSKRTSLRVMMLTRPSECAESLLDILAERWQTKEDAQQDCESEVRRLLKEAGVTVE